MKQFLKMLIIMGASTLLVSCVGSGYSHEDIPRDNAAFRDWQATTDAGQKLYVATEIHSDKTFDVVVANLRQLSASCFNKTIVNQAPVRYSPVYGTTGGQITEIYIRSQIVKQNGITSLVVKRSMSGVNVYGDKGADRFYFMLLVDIYPAGSGTKVIAYTGDPNSFIGKLAGGGAHLAQIKNAVEGKVSCDMPNYLQSVS